MVALSRSWSWS